MPRMSAVIPLLAALLLAPHGAAAQWSANTVASYLAMFMFVASLFFGYIGMYDKNFFILLGNAFCVAGSVVWIMMIMDMDGNINFAFAFAGLALFNVYGTLCVVNRYRTEGCDDSDDEDEDDEEESEDEGRPTATVPSIADKDKSDGAGEGSAELTERAKGPVRRTKTGKGKTKF